MTEKISEHARMSPRRTRPSPGLARMRAARGRAVGDLRGIGSRARRSAPAHRPLPAGAAGLGGHAVADRRDSIEQLLARRRSAPAREGAMARRAALTRAAPSPVRRRRAPASSRNSSGRRRIGVNVSGYLDTESGMGEAARASIRSLEAAGHPGRAEQRRVAAPQARRVVRERIRSTPTRIRSTWCTSTPTTWAGSPRDAARAYFKQSLHHRLLVLGTGGVPRRVGAVLRLRRRGVGRERLRARVVRRLVAGPGRAHAAAGRPAAGARARPRALRPAATRHGLPLHVRRLEPDGAQEPERRDRGLPPRRASTATRPCSCSSSPTPSTIARRCARLHEQADGLNVRLPRRLHGSRRDRARCSRPPTATSRRIAPKASA